jgi:hypothetical protein
MFKELQLKDSTIPGFIHNQRSSVVVASTVGVLVIRVLGFPLEGLLRP